MAELSWAPTASRSALLEIKDELRLVKDGYEFLDEKRILLAAEMLRQRDEHRRRQADFTERFLAAAAALVEATAEQGLQGIEVAPPAGLPGATRSSAAPARTSSTPSFWERLVDQLTGG